MAQSTHRECRVSGRGLRSKQLYTETAAKWLPVSFPVVSTGIEPVSKV